MPLRVYLHETIVPGADESLTLAMFFDNGELRYVNAHVKFPDSKTRMLMLDPDMFFVLLGDVAKDAYEAAVS